MYSYLPRNMFKNFASGTTSITLNFFGYAWGKGQYSEIPECFTAKMRMTIRQPAENLTEWVKKPMLYLITDGITSNHAIDLTTRTVLGKRVPNEK